MLQSTLRESLIFRKKIFLASYWTLDKLLITDLAVEFPTVWTYFMLYLNQTNNTFFFPF